MEQRFALYMKDTSISICQFFPCQGSGEYHDNTNHRYHWVQFTAARLSMPDAIGPLSGLTFSYASLPRLRSFTCLIVPYRH
eukprot:scaffold20028_cov41-Prasinocladus_malaysianus.AAC.1